MCTVLHNYVSLAWNYFFYLTQAIEDIDSNAKEEMKAEEQVKDNGSTFLCLVYTPIQLKRIMWTDGINFMSPIPGNDV